MTAGCLLLVAPLAPSSIVPSSRASAANGTIRGRVDLPPQPSRSDRRPSVAAIASRDHRHDDADDRPVSVVYLERAPRGAFGEPDERRVRMDQRNERFVPRVLAITVGSIVDFPNNDRTYHNVFSLSESRTFDLGRYAAGRSKAVRFERPGVVRVFCDIHSHMSAFILVFGHRFFAVTDGDGRYQIDGVPPGTYTLVAWNDGQARESVTITVPETSGVEADFVLK